ncbi:MAG: DUF2845 domain-containing protein [Desulfovermiculus sp.]|nr:DUF2845 domain-containing protein [Desulfovermiculus sp.]
MIVIHSNFFLVWFALLLLALPQSVQSQNTSVKTLHCRNNIISVGDRAAEVRSSCGEPDYIDRWHEKQIVKDYHNPFTSRRREYDTSRAPIITEKYVTVEEWTYNLGSTKFIRYLIFENGLLQEIHLGSYGN